MRTAEIQRDTLETQIFAKINLDGTGARSFSTGLPFLEHMLDQVARHGLIDLHVVANGDLEIDAHHTVEDIGIAWDRRFQKPLAIKSGSNAMAMLMCLWMKRCLELWWTCRAGPG